MVQKREYLTLRRFYCDLLGHLLSIHEISQKVDQHNNELGNKRILAPQSGIRCILNPQDYLFVRCCVPQQALSEKALNY